MIKFSEKKALRNIFGDYLVNLGKKNRKICVVSCDLKSATKTSSFFKAFPKSMTPVITTKIMMFVMKKSTVVG